MKKRQKGFTIVELVIVIAVIAILAAVLIPTFSTVIKKAKESHFLQNKRNEWLNEFVESSLDEDYETIKETPVEVSDEDAKIKQIESDFNSLFEYLLSGELYVINDRYHIHLEGIEEEFFDKTPGYSFVGWYGYGLTRYIYSYNDKYVVLYHYHSEVSTFEIRFYDDVVIQSTGSQLDGEIEYIQYGNYYKLEVVKNEKGSESDQQYAIKVVKYTESKG